MSVAKLEKAGRFLPRGTRILRILFRLYDSFLWGQVSKLTTFVKNFLPELACFCIRNSKNMAPLCAKVRKQNSLLSNPKNRFLKKAIFWLPWCTQRNSNITCSVHLSDIFVRSSKNVSKGLRVPGLKIEKPAQGRCFYFKCTRRDSNPRRLFRRQ